MRLALRLYTELIATMGYCLFMITFISAYLSPSKTVIININKFGEALLELCILLPAIPLVFFRFKEFLDRAREMSESATNPAKEDPQ